MTRNRLTALLAVAVGGLGLPATAQASYESEVLADHPLTYLRLGEAPGAEVAQDSSPNDRDGTYVGAPALGLDGPFDEAGDAAGLAAADSITATVAAASGSVELWVNPNRLAKGQQAGIVSHGDPGGDGWAVGIGNKRKLAFVSGGVTAASKVTLSSNLWTQLAVTWSGSKVNLYRNGTLAKSLNRGGDLPVSSGAELVLGGTGAGAFSGPFAGRMDEVALYSQPLSATDLEDHFLAAHVPVNTALPTISGTPEVGQTLSVNAGTWTDPGTASYQWQRCDAEGEDCEDIVGATETTYVVGDGEACGTIQVAETMMNASGSSTAISELTRRVVPCPPVNTEPPAIDDLEPLVGDTLSVTAGVWSDSGIRTYQWQRCDEAGANCEDIDGATGTDYRVAADDACGTLRVSETMTNTSGQDTAMSAPGSVVAPCDPEPGDGGGTGGGGTGGGGTGGPGGGGAGPASAPVVQNPAPPGCLKLVAARKRMKVRRLGILRLAATAKSVCVTAPLGASFKARKGVKLRSVVYKLDGRKLKRVKRKGFRARLVPAKLAAGTHTLTVRVRPRAGKAKSIKLRIRTAVA